MKRSQMNGWIEEAKAFFSEKQFQLPPWAFWSPTDWRKRREDCRGIIDAMLGWDLTDFGSGDFHRRGLLLFTLRNGIAGQRDGKPYAEKIMIVEEQQETPMHFHWSKMEDIINRGGGELVLDLYGSTEDQQLSSEPISVQVDGVRRTVKAGGSVVLRPGESICLTRGLYHRFFGQPGRGKVLVGEVSAVNDDMTDNRFHEKLPRFPDVEEDEPPVHLLASEYAKYVDAAAG
jgi:D-lyxose ketol-isomerase